MTWTTREQIDVGKVEVKGGNQISGSSMDFGF